jgi:methionyl aminopeptidase
MVNVQGTIPAPLNYAPPGYSPIRNRSAPRSTTSGLPRRSRRQGAEEGRHRQSRHHVIKDGFHGDTSRMFIVGEASHPGKRLCAVTYECLWLGIAQVRPGAHLGDIGHAIQRHAEANGFSVVREFCGHGIGRSSTRSRRCCTTASRAPAELRPGMIFTIEPMINAGKAAISELPDGWTIVTKDRSLSAQWEHTVLVTRGRRRSADGFGRHARQTRQAGLSMRPIATSGDGLPPLRQRASRLREDAGPRPGRAEGGLSRPGATQPACCAAAASWSTTCSRPLWLEARLPLGLSLVAVGGYGRASSSRRPTSISSSCCPSTCHPKPSASSRN